MDNKQFAKAIESCRRILTDINRLHKAVKAANLNVLSPGFEHKLNNIDNLFNPICNDIIRHLSSIDEPEAQTTDWETIHEEYDARYCLWFPKNPETMLTQPCLRVVFLLYQNWIYRYFPEI